MNPPPPQGYHVTDADEILEIPTKVISMLSWEGYISMFWEFVQERGYNHRQSWESCERTLAHFRLPERYSSYESFRIAKSRNSETSESEGVISFW